MDADGPQIRYHAIKIGLLVIVVYAFQHIVPALTDLAILRPAVVMQRPWTFVTSIFVHAPGDYMHLLNNTFFLLLFGTLFERWAGSRTFLVVFLLGGLAANLAAFSFYYDSAVLGMSGAVSGIVAALTVIRPRSVGLFWGAPLPMWAVLLGWVMTNLAGLGARTGVAYEAHLYGLVFGAVAGLYLRYTQRSVQRVSELRLAEEDAGPSDTEIEDWEDQFLLRDERE